jgi:hypothetical protein
VTTGKGKIKGATTERQKKGEVIHERGPTDRRGERYHHPTAINSLFVPDEVRNSDKTTNNKERTYKVNTNVKG